MELLKTKYDVEDYAGERKRNLKQIEAIIIDLVNKIISNAFGFSGFCTKIKTKHVN